MEIVCGRLSHACLVLGLSMSRATGSPLHRIRPFRPARITYSAWGSAMGILQIKNPAPARSSFRHTYYCAFHHLLRPYWAIAPSAKARPPNTSQHPPARRSACCVSTD
ncbi:hypothetical protein F5Y15DRAFT_254230 [Xylariaceae sp. FL0016]|nr:hypothetical protein F5Y15DRAFT_254230 [Xylariaceae sp. FL0016]